MKKRGKAQTTIFIVMGLVIIMVFGLVFFLSQQINDYATEKRAEQVIQGFFDATAFRQSITSCLSLSTVESIDLISRQGGFIFSYQPSSMLPQPIPMTEFDGFNISYALLEQNNPFSPCTEEPCYYNHNKKGYLFGTQPNLLHRSNAIPPLYKEYTPGFSFYFDYSYSFQEQLEKLIYNITMRCTNVSYYTNTYDVDITFSEPKINVTIGKDDVQVLMDFPFNVNMTDKIITRNYQFFTQSDIRLRRLWETMNSIVLKEKTMIDYSYQEENIPEDMNIVKNITKEGYILTVNDLTHSIRNKPYAISVAIEDRKPALDCIGYCDGSEYDIIVPVNSTLTIKPFAIDPDDEQIIYRYVGWKAEFEEIWPINVSRVGTQIDLNVNLWHNSNLFTNPSICDYPKDYMISSKGRCSQLKLSPKDIGPHTFTVFAIDKDNPNLFDYQEIRVLVDDVALPIIQNISIYDNIPSNVTSIEDPFVLDATLSGNLMGGTTLYLWSETIDNLSFETTEDRISYPRDPDIRNILRYPFKSTGTHDLRLTIDKLQSNLTSEESVYRVDTYQCLPYRRNNSAPYPYNVIRGDEYLDVFDPFLTDHTCCSSDPNSWGEFAPTNTLCYQYDKFACRINEEVYGKPQQVNTNNSIYPANQSILTKNIGILPKFNDNIIINPEHINDIYQREYQHFCDGNRGNICNGTQTDNWNHYQECGICEYCIEGDEGCAKRDYGTICNTNKKCVSDIGENSYFITSGKRDIVAIGVCNSDGNCFATIGNETGLISSNKSVAPYGFYDESKDYVLSENCNLYDKAIADDNSINETCILEDWTCINNPETKCGIDQNRNVTVHCNNFDLNPVINTFYDTCQWIDYGLNSTCSMQDPNIFQLDGCSLENPIGCCEIESQANYSVSIFDCDSLDDINISDNRLIESEVNFDSCQFGDIGSLGCEIVDVTCSESNVCKYFSSFSNITLDEVENHICIFNQTAGFMWTKEIQSTELSCSDGFDNDCDGLIDCFDPDCGSRQCEFNSVTGLCFNSSCIVSEICNTSTTLYPNCYSCGLGSTCMGNVSYPYQDNGICVYDFPLSCETSSVCKNESDVFFAGCGNCNEGNVCDTSPIDGFNPDGVCISDYCCNNEYNDIAFDQNTYQCGCTNELENFECSVKNLTQDIVVSGHCQEDNCCLLTPVCIDNCEDVACDEDSDCSTYREDTICYYGNNDNGYGECDGTCVCSYETMDTSEILPRLNLTNTCEYGLIEPGYYCLNDDYCIYNCSCGEGGWGCGIDDCPGAGNSVLGSCYYESNINLANDCNIYGCTLNEDDNPGFDFKECQLSSIGQTDYFCFINRTNTCYFFQGDACHANFGWQMFEQESCYLPGTIENDNCWFGESICDQTGCTASYSNIKPNDCSYHSGICPGLACDFYTDATGEQCSTQGWICYNTSQDIGGVLCNDFDNDNVCNVDEQIYCDNNPSSIVCTDGPIQSLGPLNMNLNTPIATQITVTNLGESGNFILRPQNNPYFNFNDLELEVPSNNYLQFHLEFGDSITLNYSITPYTTGTYSTTWNLFYDNIWPFPNTLIDTKNFDITTT